MPAVKPSGWTVPGVGGDGFDFPGDWDAGTPDPGEALGHLDLSSFVTPTILSLVGPTVTPTTTVGSQTFTSDNQTISDKIINGKVDINGMNNVTLSNCIINSTSDYAIDNRSGGSNPTVSHCTINCAGATAGSDSPYINYGSGVVEWCYFYNFGKTAFGGDGQTWTDNVMYNTRTWGGAHKECIWWNNRADVTLARNVSLVEGSGTSTAIAIYNQAGGSGAGAGTTNWLVEDNVIGSTGGYSMYCGDEGDAGAMTYGTFRRNRFTTVYFVTCGRVGPYTAYGSSNTGNSWSNNVWHDGPNVGDTL